MQNSARLTLLLAVMSLPLLGGVLTGCGFHLRGYEAPVQMMHGATVVMVDDDRSTFLLKRPLIEQLKAVGVEVVDGLAMIESGQLQGEQDLAQPALLSEGRYNAAIQVSNVRFKKYELVGVLTEIRQVITADVTYHVRQDGKLRSVTNPIQVERSYQYNAASVSTEDQQGAQIKEWLYTQLARRITDQYVALTLPKVAPHSTRTPQPMVTK